MTSEHIEQTLTTIFQDVFDDDSIAIRPDLSAKDVPAWDSLTHIRMLLSVERQFKIKFNPMEIGELKNAGDLLRLIGEKTAGSL